MKNYRIFILCDTERPYWKLPCSNAERHVETRNFFVRESTNKDYLCSSENECFVSSSPRMFLGEKDGRFKKWLKSRKAILSCKYVYAVEGWHYSRSCRSLMRFARIMHREIIEEED